ncbi:MAG: enolase [Anaerolineae bacterium]|nr:enolase [Anaerolineae bacterium]
MKIVDIHVRTFRYASCVIRDSEGHGHPGANHEARQSIVTIVADDGTEGTMVGGISQSVLDGLVKPAILGQDPFYRERIWQTLKERQRLNLSSLSDRVVAVIDCALWDLAGRALGLPVYKLLGAYRDKVPAYASTMCGDDLPGGLDTPEAYAAFAVQCRERGYPAFKLHTWQPPIPGAPDVRRDVAACAAVRQAVGLGVPLMLDPYHYYSREQSLYLGRELEKLGFAWMEEPMDEHSMSSYVWLSDRLDLAICGPETVEGKMHARAEWIKHGAADILRGGVGDVGGITPLVKIAHLAESFGMRMEVHGGGLANLHVLCAMGIPGQFYERGLLHPFVDYEEPAPWLNRIEDPMDDEGFVHVPQQPGLGWDFNYAHIEGNLI